MALLSNSLVFLDPSWSLAYEAHYQERHAPFDTCLWCRHDADMRTCAGHGASCIACQTLPRPSHQSVEQARTEAAPTCTASALAAPEAGCKQAARSLVPDPWQSPRVHDAKMQAAQPQGRSASCAIAPVHKCSTASGQLRDNALAVHCKPLLAQSAPAAAQPHDGCPSQQEEAQFPKVPPTKQMSASQMYQRCGSWQEAAEALKGCMQHRSHAAMQYAVRPATALEPAESLPSGAQIGRQAASVPDDVTVCAAVGKPAARPAGAREAALYVPKGSSGAAPQHGPDAGTHSSAGQAHHSGSCELTLSDGSLDDLIEAGPGKPKSNAQDGVAMLRGSLVPREDHAGDAACSVLKVTPQEQVSNCAGSQPAANGTRNRRRHSLGGGGSASASALEALRSAMMPLVSSQRPSSAPARHRTTSAGDACALAKQHEGEDAWLPAHSTGALPQPLTLQTVGNEQSGGRCTAGAGSTAESAERAIEPCEAVRSARAPAGMRDNPPNAAEQLKHAHEGHPSQDLEGPRIAAPPLTLFKQAASRGAARSAHDDAVGSCAMDCSRPSAAAHCSHPRPTEHHAARPRMSAQDAVQELQKHNAVLSAAKHGARIVTETLLSDSG
jgi:hypothetical protein